MAKTMEPRDQCCLCGKKNEQVKKLIVGLHGAVCDGCLELCRDILDNAPRAVAQSMPSQEEMAKGYSLDVLPSIARIFPDPAELTEILMMLARSVDKRAHRLALDET